MSHIKHVINFPRTKERHEFSDRRGCRQEESLVQPVWQTLPKRNLHHDGGAFTPGDMWQRNRNDIRQRCVHGCSQQLYWQEPVLQTNPASNHQRTDRHLRANSPAGRCDEIKQQQPKLTPMCVSSELLHFFVFLFFSMLFILFSILFTYYFLVALVFVAAQSILKSQRVGATLHCSVQASHCSGNSCCRAQALSMDSIILAHGRVHCGAAASLL